MQSTGIPIATPIAAPASAPGFRAGLWTGRVLQGLACAFLAFDGITKVLRVSYVLEATAKLGFPESSIQGIGLLLLACLALYLVPRTRVLGAVLLTGYLGGAIASQVRVEAPLLGNVLFPVYTAAMIWAPLLRDDRVRRLFGLGARNA